MDPLTYIENAIAGWFQQLINYRYFGYNIGQSNNFILTSYRAIFRFSSDLTIVLLLLWFILITSIFVWSIVNIARVVLSNQFIFVDDDQDKVAQQVELLDEDGIQQMADEWQGTFDEAKSSMSHAYGQIPRQDFKEQKKKLSTLYRIFVLRILRQTCHIDDYANTALNRKVLKKKVITIMKEENKDIRNMHVYSHADIIVELFFIPSTMDIDCRRIRYAPEALRRKYEYETPIWIGSWSLFLRGKPLWVFPSKESQ